MAQHCIKSDQLRMSGTSTDAKLYRYSSLGVRALSCWVAEPKHQKVEKAPLVAIHGLHRRAKSQARLLAPYAATAGQTVVAPRFGRNEWPLYQQATRKGRADLALLSLLDDLRMVGACRSDQIELCGYSGGAQFAHRFAMLYPHRVLRLTLIAAGWYTFPDTSPFPYGLGAPTSHSSGWCLNDVEDLQPFLRLPIRVLVGTEDNVVDENTRSGVSIDAQQGITRRERATRWVAAIRDAAHRCGVTPNITLTELKGCGHDFRSCITHPDARNLFSKYPETLQPI